MKRWWRSEPLAAASSRLQLVRWSSCAEVLLGCPYQSSESRRVAPKEGRFGLGACSCRLQAYNIPPGIGQAWRTGSGRNPYLLNRLGGAGISLSIVTASFPIATWQTGAMDLLDAVEVRVLGALLEKEITTPEYYPLSLNALVNACNQKSNRDPVVSFDPATVEEALQSLRARGLLLVTTGAGSRVAKYGHRITEKLNLGRRESAVLCELMLRGPQTLGELRTRGERMHPFDDLTEVANVIERLPELIVKLPRRPGEKEARYAHLLSGTPAVAEEGEPEAPVEPRGDRISALEAEISQLRAEVEDLKQQFAGFRKQFE